VAARRGGGGDRGVGGILAELSLELPQRPVEVVPFERLTVPAVVTLDEGDPLALERARQDHRRASGRPGSLVERIEQGSEVMTVHDDRVPAERAPPLRIGLHVVTPLRRPALTKRIDVGDGAQIVEREPCGGLRRLPDRALGRFAVAEQRIGAVGRPDPAGVQRDADRGADALPERPGGDVDERQPGCRVSLEIGVDPPQ